jgi:predicted SAM-dependent methyltransferase
MSNETSKTKKIWSETEKSYLSGDGIDIGCGNDPVFSHVIAFDQQHGDANKISQYINKKLDFVFSSHCLEHMHDPYNALKEWNSILKPGGYLFILVPD